MTPAKASQPIGEEDRKREGSFFSPSPLPSLLLLPKEGDEKEVGEGRRAVIGREEEARGGGGGASSWPRRPSSRPRRLARSAPEGSR